MYKKHKIPYIKISFGISILAITAIVFEYISLFSYPIYAYTKSKQFKQDKFNNDKQIENKLKWYRIPKILWKYTLNQKTQNTHPKFPILIKKITAFELQQAVNNTVYRLGHSTVLLKLENNFYLTDPIFSQRASPVQWAGPKRFSQLPITIDELPNIKAVVISHNHYDHLDKNTILKLSKKVEHFFTPLGVGDILVAWGVDKNKITQLDWWEQKQFNNINFIAAPSQHFSGRGLFDKNKTLWASWIIKTQDSSIFFSGDTGYFEGFKKIGQKYGPFDLSLMETGAYNVNWPDVHMQPEESLHAHIDLNSKLLLPIHNSTFSLSTHSWNEPLIRITKLALNKNIAIVTPQIGKGINFKDTQINHEIWWN